MDLVWSSLSLIRFTLVPFIENELMQPSSPMLYAPGRPLIELSLPPSEQKNSLILKNEANIIKNLVIKGQFEGFL